MNKINIAKKAVTILVGMGTTKISSDIIRNNVETETFLTKVPVFVTSIVIGMMASDATKEYTSTKIDELVNEVSEAKTKIEEAKKKQNQA